LDCYFEGVFQKKRVMDNLGGEASRRRGLGFKALEILYEEEGVSPILAF